MNKKIASVLLAIACIVLAFGLAGRLASHQVTDHNIEIAKTELGAFVKDHPLNQDSIYFGKIIMHITLSNVKEQWDGYCKIAILVSIISLLISVYFYFKPYREKLSNELPRQP